MAVLVTAALLCSAAVGVQDASARECVPEIRTVETMIEQLTADPDGDRRSGTAVDGQWMIDIAGARRELDDAKAYLREGLDFNCRLHVAKAMKRLGRMQ
jgi:hypothetical protein